MDTASFLLSTLGGILMGVLVGALWALIILLLDRHKQPKLKQAEATYMLTLFGLLMSVLALIIAGYTLWRVW